MAAEQPVQLRFRAMACPCRLVIYGPVQAAEAARDEVLRLQDKYSRYLTESVTSRINAAAGQAAVAIDEETAGLLHYAHSAWQQSQGLFDITAGVLRRAWDFRSKQPPSQAQIDALLPLIDWPAVELTLDSVRLPTPGMELDFGGFGKEYAVDAAAEAARAAGAESGLIDLGGDLRVLGPHPDGSAWEVGICDPRRPQRAIVQLPLVEGAIATSGNYQRFFTHQGLRYCHLLDPRSGWPVQGQLAGVSVAAPQCLIAGTASTVAMLMGGSKAPDWLAELGLPHLLLGQSGERQGTLQPC